MFEPAPVEHLLPDSEAAQIEARVLEKVRRPTEGLRGTPRALETN